MPRTSMALEQAAAPPKTLPGSVAQKSDADFLAANSIAPPVEAIGIHGFLGPLPRQSITLSRKALLSNGFDPEAPPKPGSIARQSPASGAYPLPALSRNAQLPGSVFMNFQRSISNARLQGIDSEAHLPLRHLPLKFAFWCAI